MPTLAELRAQLGPDAASISDEQLYAAATQAFAPMYSDPRHLREELVGKTGQWGNRFGAAIDSYQANLYGLGEAMGSTWAGQRRKENEDASNLARRVARDQGAITSYKDVGGVGDALNYVGGLAVDSSPYLLEAALGGLAGRAVAGGARLGLQLGKDLGMPAATKAASTSLGRASTAGAVAASYPSAVGDILSNQREESGGQTDLGAAAALGVPYAALNAFGLEGAAARASAFRNGVRALDNVNGVRGGLARAGATAAGMGLQEGASETGQEFLNQAGRNAVNPNAGYFGPAALDRYLESFVGGAALGGVMGGAGGGWRRSEHYKPQTPPADPTPGASTDLLNTPPQQLGWNGYHNPGQGQSPFHVFPDGSTATTGDMELMQRYGMSPQDLAAFRAQGDRFVPPGGGPGGGFAGGPTVVPGPAPVPFERQGLMGNLSPNSYGPYGNELVDTLDVMGSLPARSSPGAIEQNLGLVMPPTAREHMDRQAALVAAFNAPNGNMLSGEHGLEWAPTEGDMNAIRTGDAQAQAQQAQLIAQAKAENAKRRAAAEQDLVTRNPDGTTQNKIKEREVTTHANLVSLRDAGVLSPETFAAKVAEMDSALQAGDNKPLNAISKEAAAAVATLNARNAAGAGAAGSADVGRGAGSGVAPAQPGNVQPAAQQPAAQAVSRPGADGVRPGVAGRGDALKQAVSFGPGATKEQVEELLNRGRDESKPRRTLSAGELQLLQRINRAPERNQQIVRDLLGLDAEGHQVNAPMTYDQVGEKYAKMTGKNKGQPMDRASIQAMLAKLQISEPMIDAAHAAYAESVGSGEIASADDEGNAHTDGFRVGTAAEVSGEANIKFEPEKEGSAKRNREAARAERWHQGVNRFLGEAGMSLESIAEFRAGLDKAFEDAQAAADRVPAGNREAAAAQNRAQATEVATQAPRTVHDYLKRALAEGNIQPVDIEDAAAEYADGLDPGMPSWEDLSGAEQAAWVGEYLKHADQHTTAKEYARAHQQLQADARKRLDKTDQSRAPGGAERAPAEEPAAGGVQAGDDRAAPQVQPGDGEAVDVQKSRDTRGGADLFHDKESLEDSLLSFINADEMGRRVTVVDTAADLEDATDVLAAYDDSAVAWTRDGKAILIADRIAVGKERGVFMHEVGSHLGLERMLKPEEFHRLADKIVSWSTKDDGSLESKIAKAARERVEQAGTEGAKERKAELVAYFVEEAVNAGVDPTALKYNTELGRWMRSMWAAFKSALRKLGVKIDKLTAQDVVDLAYGMARINVTGRFHGTAADVHQFRSKFMGTGEGAQMYGWGHYFSELRGVARQYREDDVKRKSHRNMPSEPTFADGTKITISDVVQLKLLGAMFSATLLAHNWKKAFDAAEASARAAKAEWEKLNQAATDAGERQSQMWDRKMDASRQHGWTSPEYREAKKAYDAAYDEYEHARDARSQAVKRGVYKQFLEADHKLAVADRVRAHGGLAPPGAPGVKGQREMSKWVRWGELQRQARDEELLGFGSVSQLLSAYRIDRIAGVDFADQYDASPHLLALLSAAVDYYEAPTPTANVKGNIYATDLAVKAHELLDWTKSITDQPEAMREFLAKHDDLYRDFTASDYEKTGGGFYHYLVDQLKDGEHAPSANHVDPERQRFHDDMAAKYGEDWRNAKLSDDDREQFRRMEHPPRRASLYLDSHGVKGVQMPVGHMSGGTYETGRNFVVFNEKNIIRAVNNPANRISKSVQFSRAEGADSQAVSRLNDLRQAINDTMPSAARDRVTNLRDAWAKYSPYLLSNFQLMEKFGGKGPGKLESLKDHLRLTDLMTQEATRQQMQYDEVAKRWVALPDAAKTLLHDIMQRATLNRIHPDKALTDEANAHLTTEQKAEYPRLRQDWERLGRTWPAATKVYADALAVEDRAWQSRVDALEALTKRYGIAYATPKRTPGPYFPLVRFGDYLAVAKSKEFLELEDQILSVEKDDPVTRKEANKILDEMRADPKHYQVSAHETRAAADRALAGYRQQGYGKVYSAMKDQHLNALPKNMHATIAQLAAGLSKDFAPEQVGEMTKVLGQVMLQSLPEARAVMEDAARKGVAGASPDMLRAFAAKGRTDAFATSRLLYAKDLAANMQAMKAEAQEGGYDLQHVHREIEKRVALNMQFHDTPIQNAVNSVSWAYHLGMSPAFLFMNMTQPWLVSGPVLAGRFGLAKATAALGKASREAIAVLKDARFKDGKWDAWAGIHEDSVPEGRMTRNAEGKMVSEDRKALRELMQRGIVDEGLNHEMSAFSSGYGKLEQARKVMGWASQQVELVNRTATALAAFRLARDGGMDYNDAVEYAYRTSVQTQIDYSAEGAPRFMRTGGGIPMAKMMFQFRRYQQAMAMLLLGNLKKSFGSGKEAEVARATLGYFGITTLMTAGVMGLPGFTAAAFLLGLGDDDDDERGDLKTRLRNYLVDMTGDKAMADALAKGLPTLMGADLSGRIGMGDVFSLYPRLDLSTARSVDEKMGRVAAAVMGPGVGGLGAQAFRAGQFFEQGDWAKGTEQLVPKMAADVIQAGRTATKGMTDMKGEQILGADEISAWDTTLRALGVSPQDQANYYEANAAINKVKRATADRKAQIHNQYRAALHDGDMSDVRALIDKFNEDHPQSPIKPKDELAWRKDARKQESMRGLDGIKLDPKRDRQYRDLVRFAQ